MNASTNIEIHEFSTGIRPEKTANGWVSRGFTGQYMNATIDPIPYAVERSIANKEFAVAEGTYSEQPAVIGRVVGSGESAWSVIAIVTRGKDEKGRSVSLYRYFLCEGDGHLSDILTWIEDYGSMPVFNPFETKIVGKPNISRKIIVTSSRSVYISTFNSNVSSEEFLQPCISHVSSESLPVIVPPGEYKEQELNQLAKRVADEHHQSVAWAFNVEALEQIGRFQVIKAASQKAYELLSKAKDNATKYSIQVVVEDEEMIKSAMRGLINSSTVKPQYIEDIANSLKLENDQACEKYWRDIFDGQGATNALKQGIYSPQMVRLLMLRAIVLPYTLPEYLNWLEKGNKQSDLYTVAFEFESQISKSLTPSIKTNITANISEGLQILLPSLLNKEVSNEAVNKLLASNNGLWRKLCDPFIENIDNDLNLMHKIASKQQNLSFNLKGKSWINIWQELRICWREPDSPLLEKYQSFAKVFSTLNKFKISAFFYHVAKGEVPKEIFAQLQSYGWRTTVYKVTVKREVAISELLWLTISKLGSKIVPVAIVIPLVLVSLSLGIVLRGFFQITQHETKANVNLPENNNSNFSNPVGVESSQATNTEAITQAKLKTAQEAAISSSQISKNVKKIQESSQAILSISDELAKKTDTYDKSQIEAKIMELIQPKLTFDDIKNKSDNDIRKKTDMINNFINDITKYQKTKQEIKNADGVIKQNQKTSNILKCEVAKQMNIELLDKPKDCEK